MTPLDNVRDKRPGNRTQDHRHTGASPDFSSVLCRNMKPNDGTEGEQREKQVPVRIGGGGGERERGKLGVTVEWGGDNVQRVSPSQRTRCVFCSSNVRSDVRLV